MWTISQGFYAVLEMTIVLDGGLWFNRWDSSLALLLMTTFCSRLVYSTMRSLPPNTTETLSIPGVSEESLALSTNPLKMCLSLEVALVRNLQQQYALKEQNMNNPRCNRGYTTTHLGTALKELNMKIMGSISHQS